MGDVVRGNSRRIYLNVTGGACIDYVDVVKNGQILARMNGPLTAGCSGKAIPSAAK